MTTLEVTQQKSESQSVPVLAALWRSRIKTISAGVERPLTPKEFGQLKLLKQCLGSATRDVLDWALNNWSQFANKAACEAGSCPTTPHIGFLLKHYVVAAKQLQSIADHKKQKEELMAKYDINKHVESVADPKPVSKIPIKVKFTAEQKVLLMAGLDDTGKFEEFLAKVTEKYGEGCIMCGGDPVDAVLCDVA